MTYQLEVVKFRDLIEVTEIPRLVPEFEQPTLEVRGDDFSSVDSVLVNEMPAPEFIIINKSTMYVQLPAGALNAIRTIEVISSSFTKTIRSSKLLFQIGDSPKTVFGIVKLLQLFTKWMLQSPGSDVFNPERGGGLQEITGKLISTRKMEPIMAAVTRSVNMSVSQIRTAQMNRPQIPLDERLLRASVIDLNVFESEMEARIRILVESSAGRRAVAELGL
jgi:hypothetical protein